MVCLRLQLCKRFVLVNACAHGRWDHSEQNNKEVQRNILITPLRGGGILIIMHRRLSFYFIVSWFCSFCWLILCFKSRVCMSAIFCGSCFFPQRKVTVVQVIVLNMVLACHCTFAVQNLVNETTLYPCFAVRRRIVLYQEHLCSQWCHCMNTAFVQSVVVDFTCYCIYSGVCCLENSCIMLLYIFHLVHILLLLYSIVCFSCCSVCSLLPTDLYFLNCWFHFVV